MQEGRNRTANTSSTVHTSFLPSVLVGEATKGSPHQSSFTLYVQCTLYKYKHILLQEQNNIFTWFVKRPTKTQFFLSRNKKTHEEPSTTRMVESPSNNKRATAIASVGSATAHLEEEVEDADCKYLNLVIDSGPIIKLKGIASLREKAHNFYTVPAVVNEIRDAKARHHLQNLPFDVITREPAPSSIQAVVEFARLTGDYHSLSGVDVSVLALAFELEKEGCGGSTDHIRTKPKRTCGVGKIELLNPNANTCRTSSKGKEEKEDNIDYDIVEEEDECASDEEVGDADKKYISFFEGKPQVQGEKPLEDARAPIPQLRAQQGPKSWAMLVNPTFAEEVIPGDVNPTKDAKSFDGGQFNDAEDDGVEGLDDSAEKVGEELQKDFPSLAASVNVPFEGEDSDVVEDKDGAKSKAHRVREEMEEEEQRKKEALMPLSKSGKVYNSFRGYGKLFKPEPKKTPVMDSNHSKPIIKEDEKKIKSAPELEELGGFQSRIIGGVNMSGQDVDIEDDGEGWITCKRDICSLQAAGTLAPPKDSVENDADKGGPALRQRTACATTDFAMQNVLLQMNLELLSVDGVKIKRLKNWVSRCGACFKVYTKVNDSGPHGMKRLFCERCGSDMLQRIAASVDGKTGRLRLHMSRKHKNSNRGSKFSLPKPGGGDRFQGDLLLREDQLLMGAWSQNVKKRSGGKAKSAAQSMFGQDIAANVGCKARSMNVDDIAAGFGRRNPNSAKGRERRGKKKKTKEKACGLRRYH